MVEEGQSMKAINLCDGSWDRPTLGSFNLGFINLNFLSKNNVSKKNNLRSKSSHFLSLIYRLVASILRTLE